jgi:hypothetical protein
VELGTLKGWNYFSSVLYYMIRALGLNWIRKRNTMTHEQFALDILDNYKVRSHHYTTMAKATIDIVLDACSRYVKLKHRHILIARAG